MKEEWYFLYWDESPNFEKDEKDSEILHWKT
jgi:hypothetical protein